MSNPTFMDAVVLLGDSITETNADGTFTARIAEWYGRKMDVLNRGYGGFNTKMVLPLIPQIFGRLGEATQRVRMVVIWLGTNDASFAPAMQHVPVDVFKKNLKDIITGVRQAVPDCAIVLITPGQMFQSAWNAVIREWVYVLQGKSADEFVPNRDAPTTKLYVEAVMQVGEEENVAALNAWELMTNDAGGEDAPGLSSYFTDGIHMTSKGYALIFNAFTKLVGEKYPELYAVGMKRRIPDWLDIEKNPELLYGEDV